MSYLRNPLRELLFLFIIFSGSLNAQEKEVREISHAADETAFSKSLGTDIIRLLGVDSIWFDDFVLFCDSAHLNQKNKSFRGFGNVHIIKADTLQLWGDKLNYDGNSKMTQLDGRVRMEHNQTILKTNHLSYNMDEEIAWYYGGGQIIDTSNVVESGWGYYYLEKYKR